MTSSQAPKPVRPAAYRGEPLDAERGPGLGCFRFQLGLLLVLLVLTPLSVSWDWPVAVSAGLLFLTLLVLLFAGQTVMFLLRVVAAERREGRRRPLASATPTVGELEDAESTAESTAEPTAEPTNEPPTPREPRLDVNHGTPDPGMRE